MTSRKSSLKQKFDQQVQRTRVENDQLMRLRVTKKKLDLNGRYDKKDIHNILNSLLQGEVIEEDLFNQFWEHYFTQAVTLREVLRAYNSTLIMLVQKIANNNNRITELGRDRERAKHSHDFKNVNAINLDLDELEGENRQFNEDLKELSKPFQFNFTPLIETYSIEYLKNSKTVLPEQPKKSEKSEEDPHLASNVFDFIVAHVQEKSEERSEEIELTDQEKYHRFVIYTSCIALLVDLSMAFNKHNFTDLILGIIFVGNSLLEDYLLKQDPMNQLMAKVEVSLADDRLMVRDAYTPEQIKKAAVDNIDTHSFENYANYGFLLQLGGVLLDGLWLLLMGHAYNNAESAGYVVETDSYSLWRYNSYIFYASLFTLLSKTIAMAVMFQLSSLSFDRLFTRHNCPLLLMRFSDYSEVINSLLLSK